MPPLLFPEHVDIFQSSQVSISPAIVPLRFKLRSQEFQLTGAMISDAVPPLHVLLSGSVLPAALHTAVVNHPSDNHCT